MTGAGVPDRLAVLSPMTVTFMRTTRYVRGLHAWGCAGQSAFFGSEAMRFSGSFW